MSPAALVPLHGIASRHDLPLPFSFVIIGAAAALVVSFALLFFAWRSPKFLKLTGISLPGLTRLVDHGGSRLTVQLLVLAVYAWAALALFAGKDLLTNPIFGFVFAWMWVGLVPLSLLLGPFWRVTNPLRTIHRGLCSLAQVDPAVGLARLPAKLGVWPAAVGIFAFGWLELVQPDRATLGVLRVWALAWLVSLIIGSVIFGSAWIAAADPFEAFAETIAQLSPIRRVDGALRMVNPLAGLSSWDPPRGAGAVVSMLLGITAFDSFANTSWWIKTVQNSDLPQIWWATGGLIAMALIVGVTFSLSTRWMALFSQDPHLRAADLPRLMAGSVAPIVVGYAIAHYATLLIVEGQRTALLFSDPLGRGWNVFGTAELSANTAIFDHPTLVAVIQLTSIVVGHIVGIVVAHERSLTILQPKAALRGQLPLLVVMVFYTCSGLILLFSP